ncbi:uncharacterized protein LOC122076001 isoform X4 [Macadamia integrifolia]|uniref:uncharacterized protein LOC122076001 isoform X4 n=1 Tax=Macadamia integrifolia TaxID=60698 RepID=UPI001C500208|nr:uncharacterized protein LOC122076001 isoform X4 [Macadamia integrifolia]
MCHNHHFPCLCCHPNDYIRMYFWIIECFCMEIQVQHLIERCLLLRMSRDDCIEALAEHASIRPLITLTVWKELFKENRQFFQEYFDAVSPRPFNFNGRTVERVSRFSRRTPWK